MSITYTVHGHDGPLVSITLSDVGKRTSAANKRQTRLQNNAALARPWSGMVMVPCVVCDVPTRVGDDPTDRRGERTVIDGDLVEATVKRFQEHGNAKRLARELADIDAILTTFPSGEADRMFADHSARQYGDTIPVVTATAGPGKGYYSISTIGNLCSTCNGTRANTRDAHPDRDDIRAASSVVLALNGWRKEAEGGNVAPNGKCPTVEVVAHDRAGLADYLSRFTGGVAWSPFAREWVAGLVA